jgi:ABC-type Mn2+/Zn2+ transport system ATPase subunit
MVKDRSEDATVLLDSIEIEGFRSCRSTKFQPNAQLSALIGINGAGKTNILQAIRLLDARRGRARSVPEQTTGLTKLTAWFTVNKMKVGLKLTLSPIESSRRSGEVVTIDELWNLSSFTGSRSWRPMPPAGFLKERPRDADFSKKQIFLYHDDFEYSAYRAMQNHRFDTSILDNKAAVAALIAIHEFRSGIRYYSASQFTDPSRCPSSFEVDEEGRASDSFAIGTGSAHLRFLYSLYSLKRSNTHLYDQYCQFVSRHQLGLISRITWKEIELSTSTAEVRSSGTVKKIKKRKTLVVPKVQVGTSHITFNQLSEGTFKTLALAFYVITDASKFLMIEEPEVCVHHGLLRKIIETIKSYSHHKQTIISTHSDLLVDELEPANLFLVEMTAAGTAVKALNDWLDNRGRNALHAYLAESGPLGEYWRSGGLT